MVREVSVRPIVRRSLLHINQSTLSVAPLADFLCVGIDSSGLRHYSRPTGGFQFLKYFRPLPLINSSFGSEIWPHACRLVVAIAHLLRESVIGEGLGWTRKVWFSRSMIRK